jgi:hypothetical protein
MRRLPLDFQLSISKIQNLCYTQWQEAREEMHITKSECMKFNIQDLVALPEPVLYP